MQRSPERQETFWAVQDAWCYQQAPWRPQEVREWQVLLEELVGFPTAWLSALSYSELQDRGQGVGWSVVARGELCQ